MEQKRASTVYIERSNHRWNEVLLVWNQRFGGWCLPGGKVEPNEDRMSAASRELMEETGLSCSEFRLIYEAIGTLDRETMVDVYEPAGRIRCGGRRGFEWFGELIDLDPELHQPVCWMPRETLTQKTNPFAEFYEKFFQR